MNTDHSRCAGNVHAVEVPDRPGLIDPWSRICCLRSLRDETGTFPSAELEDEWYRLLGERYDPDGSHNLREPEPRRDPVPAHTCMIGALCPVAEHDCPRDAFLDDPITVHYGVGAEMVHLIACPVCDAHPHGCGHESCEAIMHADCLACFVEVMTAELTER